MFSTLLIENKFEWGLNSDIIGRQFAHKEQNTVPNAYNPTPRIWPVPGHASEVGRLLGWAILITNSTMKYLLNNIMEAHMYRSKFSSLSPEEERKRQIIESDYGRTGGWYVEYNGRRIAVLSDPQYQDMFWVSYAIEPLTDDDEERRQLLESEQFWLTKFVYRSKQFGEIAENAIPAGTPFIRPGRINMRGLYLILDP